MTVPNHDLARTWAKLFCHATEGWTIVIQFFTSRNIIHKIYLLYTVLLLQVFVSIVNNQVSRSLQCFYVVTLVMVHFEQLVLWDHLLSEADIGQLSWHNFLQLQLSQNSIFNCIVVVEVEAEFVLEFYKPLIIMRQLPLNNIQKWVIEPEGHWKAVLTELIGNIHLLTLLQLMNEHQLGNSNLHEADADKQESLDGPHVHNNQEFTILFQKSFLLLVVSQ